MTALQLVASIANLLALFMILSFLRRERLKEKYSLLWLLCIVVAEVLILSYHWIDRFAAWMGVFYPPSLIFFLAILFLFVMVLHLTLVVSKQNKQIQILAQQLALLEARVSPGTPPSITGDPKDIEDLRSSRDVAR